MSTNATVQKIACLSLFEGMTVTDPTSGLNVQLSGQSSIEMGPNRTVSIVGDTILEVPTSGVVKAVTNTSLKYPSGTKFIKSDGPVSSIRIKLPACTLREHTKGNK